jgi:hypothetical protein
MNMFLRKLTLLTGFLGVFLVSSLAAPFSSYAFSISPSLKLECGSNDKILFNFSIVNNELSDTLVLSLVNSNFSGELEGGTVSPGQTQFAMVQIEYKSISAGSVIIKNYKQNNPGTVETQSVSFGSFSCPLPTATPTSMPTNIPTPTATPVPQSTNTSSSIVNKGATNTPTPTQKPVNTTYNNEQMKPTVTGTNSHDQFDEKEQKNKEKKQIAKVETPVSVGVFTLIRNIFVGKYLLFFAFR